MRAASTRATSLSWLAAASLLGFAAPALVITANYLASGNPLAAVLTQGRGELRKP